MPKDTLTPGDTYDDVETDVAYRAFVEFVSEYAETVAGRRECVLTTHPEHASPALFAELQGLLLATAETDGMFFDAVRAMAIEWRRCRMAVDAFERAIAKRVREQAAE